MQNTQNEKNWLSMYVFYHNNNNPLLVNCVRPLVDELREQGLLQRFFFIKYWMEGPHVRLRFLPASGLSREELKPLIEERVSAYLRRQPSLLMADEKGLQPLYKGLFEAEYGAERWAVVYPSGIMPLRPNNSFHYVEYEPEYARYGGVAGVDLSEWHFEHSSELTIWLIRETNVHIRTVMLGIAAQLMLHFCYGLLQDDQAVARFLDGYMQYWNTFSHSSLEAKLAQFEKRSIWTREGLLQKVARIRHAALHDDRSQLITFERNWHAHIQELRRRIFALATAEKLRFAPPAKAEQSPVTDPLLACRMLLHGYVHMTNNRLGCTIPDEVYLSYVLKRCLTETIHSQEVPV
jgi:hypothetical protein